MDEGTSRTGWAELDRDALAEIIRLLEPREVVTVACTCRNAYHIFFENAVWAPLLARYFGLSIQAPSNVRLVNLFATLCNACKSGTGGGAASRTNGGGAAASSSAKIDTALLGAVQLEGLYTDGGMDMGDPTFWVGNVFEPNGWSIYCSRAGRNVHCIAQLKAVHVEEPFMVAHRTELISLAADVAWLMFLGRLAARNLERLLRAAAAAAVQRSQTGGGTAAATAVAFPASSADALVRARALCGRLRTAMLTSLRHWPTQGLEQLLWQLTLRFKLLRGIQQQQQQGAAAEVRAAAGGGGVRGGDDGDGDDCFKGGGDLARLLAGRVPQMLEAAVMPLALGPGAARQDLDLDPEDISGSGVGMERRTAAEGAGVAAAVVPVLPPRLSAVWKDVVQGRSRSGRQALAGLGATGEGLQVWSRSALECLKSPGLECTTAIIDGITVSRTGEFTCPVACGALFITQRPPAAGLWAMPHGGAAAGTSAGIPTAAAPAGAIDDDSGGGADGFSRKEGATDRKQGQNHNHEQQQQQQNSTEKELECVRQVFEDMVRQPYVQALSDLTTLAAVEEAVAAGLLPPLAARGSCPGAGEWVEFQRPPPPPMPVSSAMREGSSAPGASLPTTANSATSAAAAAAVISDAGFGAGSTSTALGPAWSATAPSSVRAHCAGVLWPVVWFRFYPHDGLGDEGDQGMALPPVLFQPQPQPPPLPPAPMHVDVEEGWVPPAPPPPLLPPGGVSQRGRDGYLSTVPDPDYPDTVPSHLTGAGFSGDSSNNDSDSSSRGTSRGPNDYYMSGVSNDDDDEEEEEEEEEEVENHEDVAVFMDGGGGASASGGRGAGGEPIVWRSEDSAVMVEWEFELDFLYGIEGQPHSYHATAGQSDIERDEGDVPHAGGGAGPSTNGEEPNGGAGPSTSGEEPNGGAGPSISGEEPNGGAGPSTSGEEPNGGAGPSTSGEEPNGGAGPSTSGRTATPVWSNDTLPAGHVTDRGAEGAHVRGPRGPHTGGQSAGSRRSRHRKRPQRVSSGLSGVAVYENAGELLQGVPMRAWLKHLVRPDVAGMVLGSVAEVAGVQALRHTFQNVQTALQPSAALLPAAAASAVSQTALQSAAAAAVARGDRGGQVTTVPAAACCLSAAAAASTGGIGAATAAAEAHGSGAAAPSGDPDGCGGASTLVAVVLPPDESAEHAFDGLPDVAPLTLPQSPQTDDSVSRLSSRQPPSGHLCMLLRQRWCGNTVLLKLISPEDRSEEFGEEPDTAPNIDVQFVALRGVTLALQPPLRLLP